MTTTTTRSTSVLTDLALAAGIVEQIGEHRVSSVMLFDSYVGIHLADPDEGQAIADALGLVLDGEPLRESGKVTYAGMVDGRRVQVFGNPPAAFVVVDSDTGEHLTGRLSRSVADAVVAAEFSRRVRVEQVTR